MRALHRTSLPIPYAGGRYDAKPLISILGGILALESEWKPALGGSLADALRKVDVTARLDLGCVAAHGMFYWEKDELKIMVGAKPATAFLLELIARLQESATVPMIDIRAYAQWLDK